MAYSDYKAIVTCNGERREDREDTSLFPTQLDKFNVEANHAHHGILGSGNVRLIIHKQGLPELFESEDGIIKKIFFCGPDVDVYDYSTFDFDYKGYKFRFSSERPFYASMKEPDGTLWEAVYDYKLNSR